MTVKIEMVDLRSQHQRLKSELDAAISSVVDSGRYINGPQVRSFENELAGYLGVRHVIACANGTDALTVALMALGLNPGDEVITSSFSFIATAEAIVLLGLKPVFADIDPVTFNIDPDSVLRKITNRTKAIIPVHLYGQSADMEPIMKIAADHNLFVVEDNAQSLGATYKTGAKTGTIGHIGCTSFFPSKNLGCLGDGGALFCNDDTFAAKIRRIVNHGSDVKYYHTEVGLNSRLDTIQAAVLLVKLSQLDDFNHRRQQAARYYSNALKGIDGIVTPEEIPGNTHIYHQYTIRVKGGKRDLLRDFLGENQIPSMVYYPVPLHKQKVFEGFVADEALCISEVAASEVLSLPMHTELDDAQLKFITDTIIRFFEKQ